MFHVQTEDSGVTHPHVFTHVFHGGVIIKTEKLDYDPSLKEPEVKQLMQELHKKLMKQLKAGTFDEKIDQYLAKLPELQPSPFAASRAKPSTHPPELQDGAVSSSVVVSRSSSLSVPPEVPRGPTVDEVIWKYLQEEAA